MRISSSRSTRLGAAIASPRPIFPLASSARKRTASTVCPKDVENEMNRAIGSANQRSETGESRLKPIASSFEVDAAVALNIAGDAEQPPDDSGALTFVQDVLGRGAVFFDFLDSCSSGDAVCMPIVHVYGARLVVGIEGGFQKE